MTNVQGNLYLVATPIGNLEDLSYRAVAILKHVDVIACEDTRHTRRLLDRFEIDKPTVSYHEHNELSRAEDLIGRLRSGQNVALVSDAGTPLISDPGYRVVAAAVEAEIPVIPVPGPSAIVTALMASGLPAESFYFGGFLPAKQAARRRALCGVAGMNCTLVFYEAPHRILEALEDIGEALPGRPVVLARELTKLHEEFLRGSAADVITALRQKPSVKGEFTIVIGKPAGPPPDTRSVCEIFNSFLDQGYSRMDAIKAAARARGVSKREIYAELEDQR